MDVSLSLVNYLSIYEFTNMLSLSSLLSVNVLAFDLIVYPVPSNFCFVGVKFMWFESAEYYDLLFLSLLSNKLFVSIIIKLFIRQKRQE
jgi:hypothetical protein